MYDTAALKMSILDREAAFNQAIAGMKPNGGICLEFILHAINAAKPAILSQRRGVRQKNLSLTKIKNIVLPVPELAVQKAAVSELRAVAAETQRIASIYVRKLAALDELKQSLLHEAFSGRLTERTLVEANVP
jgi:type I restriction enzyme S subunit